MLSLLQESQSWYAYGTFKVVPEQFFQLYTIHAEKGSTIVPCIYALLTNKTQATNKKLFTKILEINPELNPFLIMVDFEKASINAFEEKFLSVVSGCFSTCHKIFIARYNQLGLLTNILKIQISLSLNGNVTQFSICSRRQSYSIFYSTDARISNNCYRNCRIL